MKIVVMSDSHGYSQRVDWIKEKEKDADIFIHCGDVCDERLDTSNLVCVKGNNDYFANYPFQRIVEKEGLRILITHSSQFGYQDRYQKLERLGKANQCQIVCFGHTHIFHHSNQHGTILVNPGSCWYNRNGDKPSYAIIEYVDGKINIQQQFITDN